MTIDKTSKILSRIAHVGLVARSATTDHVSDKKPGCYNPARDGA